jgi:hypothetical protein
MPRHAHEPDGYAFMVFHREPQNGTPASGMTKESLERSRLWLSPNFLCAHTAPLLS